MSNDRTINIVIKEDGSRVVKRNLEDLGSTAKTADGALELLKKSIETLVAAEAVRQLVQMVNQYQELHNQLLFVTSGQANLNAVFDKLTQIAAATHTSVAQNVQEFSALSQATRDLGLSQAQVIQFQTRLNEAVGLSGAGSKDAADAVTLLGKSLATGRLEGGAFTRTLQSVPIIGDILARTLHVTRGELKDMAETGQLSAQQLVDAFAKAGPALDKQFKGIQPTISDTFTELKDQLMLTIGAFSDATGGGNLLVNMLRDVTDFLKEITPQVVSFAHALTGTLDPEEQLTMGMKVFASILVIVIGSLELIAQVIKTVVVGAFKTVGQIIGGLAASIKDFVLGVVDEFTAIIDGVTAIPQALKQASKGDFAAAGKTLADAFKKPWDEAGADFDRSADELGNVIDDTFTNVGDTLGTSFDKISKSGEQMWDKLDKIWDEGQRNLQKKSVIGAVSTKTGPNNTTQFSAQELEATRKALAQLLGQFDPLQGAVLRLTEDELLLVKAQREGIITKGQESQYLQELIKHYQDILDPVGLYIRKLDEETGLLKFNADQRQIETELLQKTQEWQLKGIPVTQQEIDTIRSKLQAQQDLNKIVTEQDSLLAGSVKQREQFANQLTAIQNLLSTKSGFTKADAINALSAQNPDLFANTTEQFEAQAQKFQTMYSAIDAMRQKDLISEQTAAAMRVKVWSMQSASQLQTQSEFFGDLAQLSKSNNSKIAAIGKAAAITQATINTYQAATAAYASLASIPYVGPALGAAAAAAAIVAGLANIAQIRNQPTGFMTGGSFTVPGGTGGADSQMVAFRATPGERVSIATPAQVRKGDPNGGGSAANAAPAQLNARIVNVFDPGVVGDYLATQEGEQLVMNVMRRNSDTVKSIAGSV